MTAPGSPHRAWIEVDHAAIRHNLSVIRGLAPGASVIGIVKANAYGHGDVAVARTLVAAGVERLGVATIDEAVALREAGIDVPIIVLWAIGPQEVPSVVELRLEPIVFDRRTIDLLAAAAGSEPIGVHLKLDTGLGRQGAAPGEAVSLAGGIVAAPGLRLAGTMTHLAIAGEDEAATDVQLLRLARALDALRSAGIDPGTVHVSASGGILAGHVGPADAIRPGIALYGLLPAWAADRDPGLRPALSIRARALNLFDLPAGEALGYGFRFRTPRDTRIATLGIGYGDGWPRAHANNGWVLVRGQRAPIVGAISMDGLTVDVGQVAGVTYDDEFVLIGEQEGARITADEVAAERRTINYEVTTALRSRLPRLHREGA
ncbi:MAG TPA: alanine racemase [Patescibacteria group bacterium]|nr:alanine racemase [Patescibacteria group bacterium]